jgi:hypothetical protein
MRAFIFSLDAFVAFTLALVAIYSLIFFSSIPSSYYYLLTQGHFLARDVLYSISSSECYLPLHSCSDEGATLLENIVFGETSVPGSGTEGKRVSVIKSSIGASVPNQFGYIVEVSEDNGKTWAEYYNTENEPADKHADSRKKLSVSSQIPVFEHITSPQKDVNPYYYRSCMGDGTDFLITCSEPIVGEADVIPEVGVKLFRLTIFI